MPLSPFHLAPSSDPARDVLECDACGTAITSEVYFGSGRCAACRRAMPGVPVLALLFARLDAAVRRMEDAAEWDTPIRYERAKADRDAVWATIRRLSPLGGSPSSPARPALRVAA
ncbi:MAG TPA: hypothetical protein VD838_10895 [Anaeromyxobacteraceae bacterium]|nr:hypothetical protein [Anaeromyxobacteraceae bacterium]